MRGGAPALLLLALGAVSPAEGDDARPQDWACAAQDPSWHKLRESVRYAMHEPHLPKRASLRSLVALVPAWQTMETGFQNPERVQHPTPCLLGEVFMMIVDTVFLSLANGGGMNLDRLLEILEVLERLGPSAAAVLHSSWPIFGALVVAQQMLGLGTGNGDENARLPELAPYTRLCRAGLPLAAALQGWMDDPAATASAMHAGGVGEAAASLVGGGPARCDPAGDALGRLALAVATRNSSELLVAGRLDAGVDAAFLRAGWRRSFFSGWPVLSLLHRLQDLDLRHAACDRAEPGAYGLLSLAAPESVWLCVKRSPDMVYERWRNQGVFEDCEHIVGELQRRDVKGQDCLFADVGANLGGCALVLGRLGFEVAAFEPVPTMARLLRGAVARNGLEGRVSVMEAAVGRHPGEARFMHCSQSHSATCQALPLPEGGAGGGVGQVRSVSLDAEMRERSSRKLCAVKVDVEGAEEEVLLGGESTLRGQVPPIFLELHPRQLISRGSSPEKVLDLLHEYGYRSFETLGNPAWTCSGAEVKGGGAHPDSRWQGGEVLLEARSEDACRCSSECYSRMTDGCRCWDFEQAASRCRLMRRCRLGQASLAAAGAGWWAGELDGNLLAV